MPPPKPANATTPTVAPAEPIAPEPDAVTIAVPMLDLPAKTYVPGAADYRLTGTACRGLVELEHALRAVDARMADGRRITDASHALQWLLERLAHRAIVVRELTAAARAAAEGGAQ